MESKEFLMKKGVRSIGQLMVANDVVQIMDEYAAPLHKRIAELEAEVQTHVGLVDHMKEVCDEYEKELQMKQKTIDALLDPEY